MKRSEQQKEKKGGTRLSGLASGIFSRIARTTPNDAAYPALTCRRRRAPQFRRLLYIVVLALLCFGGCSSPSFPVRYVRIPFAAPLAKLGTRVRRGVSFEAAPRTTSATAASSSLAPAALASASLPSKEESWAFPYDLLAHIGR